MSIVDIIINVFEMFIKEMFLLPNLFKLSMMSLIVLISLFLNSVVTLPY